MIFTTLLLTHICGAVVGLISGYLSMVLRKGSGLHRAAGMVFTVAMLLMTSSGAIIATAYRLNALNVVVSLLTFYLVLTAWWAGRRRDLRTGPVDVAGAVYIISVAAGAIGYGLEAASSASSAKDGMPAPIYFVFGTVALLCASTDVRLLLRGSLVGAQRLVRHLWRMCLALLIATLSLYPGQAKLFPMWVRESKMLFAMHLFLIGSMIYYAFRTRARKRRAATVAESALAIASRQAA